MNEWQLSARPPMDMTGRLVCFIDTVGCTYLYPDSIDRILSISIRVMSGLLEFYPISISIVPIIMELTYHDIDRCSTTIAIAGYRDIDRPDDDLAMSQ